VYPERGPASSGGGEISDQPVGRRKKIRRRVLQLVFLLALPTVAYFTVLGPTGCHRASSVRVPAAKGTTMLFPTVRAQTLSGRCVVFPDETQGKVGIYFVAFEQQAQSQIDTWVDPFIRRYLDREDVSYFEIPMISTVFRPVAKLIDGGMRGGVPRSLHDRTATFYGNRKAFFERLAIKDRSKAYLFVVDRSGEILFRAEGSFSEQAMISADNAVLNALNQ
jgi:ATP10 protein